MPDQAPAYCSVQTFKPSAFAYVGCFLCLWLFSANTLYAQDTENVYTPDPAAQTLSTALSEWITPEQLDNTIQTVLLLGAVSLAPAIILMTTCFVRIVVVLGLLRAALGLQTLPSTQVITSLALFMSLAIMSPVWKQVYDEGVKPYSNKEKTLDEAWTSGIEPVRRFMSVQIEATSNQDDIWLFMKYMPQAKPPENYSQVPLEALLPAEQLSQPLVVTPRTLPPLNSNPSNLPGSSAVKRSRSSSSRPKPKVESEEELRHKRQHAFELGLEKMLFKVEKGWEADLKRKEKEALNKDEEKPRRWRKIWFKRLG